MLPRKPEENKRRTLSLLFFLFSLSLKPKLFKYNQPFLLESGGELPSLEIAFHTYGGLNKKKDNVIWVCHALTANSDVYDWWGGLFGKDQLFNEEKYFIVCANIIGSCYGTTGPLSENPLTGSSYYNSFPFITVRDQVNAHKLLKDYLGIKKIHAGIGGSLGGYQLLEWAVSDPEIFDNLILMVTSARESSWGRAIHSAQRMAIEADCTFRKNSPEGGKEGLKTARAIGLLTYRNYEIFCARQPDPDNIYENFNAESYLKHQGEKLAARFNAYSYRTLTKTMDSHNLARGRGKLENVLGKIRARTLVIGISSDILCPLAEQKFLAKYIPGAILIEIDSPYGHDGFLIEHDQLSRHIRNFLSA